MYLAFVLNVVLDFVDTPMVQEHILKHGGNERLYTIMLQLAELTHLAYDCPKKHSAVNVLRAARALLAEAP